MYNKKEKQRELLDKQFELLRGINDVEDPEFSKDLCDYLDGNEHRYRFALEVFMQTTDDFFTFTKLYNEVDFYDMNLFHYLKKGYNLAVKDARKRDEDKKKQGKKS